MGLLQTLVNGIVLGGLYSCLAVGFSLVWGVLNVINMIPVEQPEQLDALLDRFLQAHHR